MATEICRCAGIHFEEVVIGVTSENPELPNRRVTRSWVGKYRLHQLATGVAEASCSANEGECFSFSSSFLSSEQSLRNKESVQGHVLKADPNVS